MDRGPNWLLVKVHSNQEGPLDDVPLAERVWHLMEEHFVYRLVLELDEVDVLDNLVIRQLGRVDHECATTAASCGYAGCRVTTGGVSCGTVWVTCSIEWQSQRGGVRILSPHKLRKEALRETPGN